MLSLIKCRPTFLSNSFLVSDADDDDAASYADEDEEDPFVAVAVAAVAAVALSAGEKSGGGGGGSDATLAPPDWGKNALPSWYPENESKTYFQTG